MRGSSRAAGTTGPPVVATGCGCLVPLELEAQSELHHARIGERLRVLAERRGLMQAIAYGMHVIAHGVRDVECFPAQLGLGTLGDAEILAQSGVDTEIAIAAQWIARAGFTRIRAAESGQHARRILERIRPLAAVTSACGKVPLQVGPAFDVPIGGPLTAFIHAEGITAGPAEQASELPAADKSVRQAVCARSELPAFAKWQLVNPVGIDLVRGVEIRNPAQLFWPPGVDDLRVVIAAGRADSLRGRSPVHGFRPGVVKVSLQAVAKALAKGNLNGVVARHGDGPPRSEQRAL